MFAKRLSTTTGCVLVVCCLGPVWGQEYRIEVAPPAVAAGDVIVTSPMVNAVYSMPNPDGLTISGTMIAPMGGNADGFHLLHDPSVVKDLELVDDQVYEIVSIRQVLIRPQVENRSISPERAR